VCTHGHNHPEYVKPTSNIRQFLFLLLPSVAPIALSVSPDKADLDLDLDLDLHRSIGIIFVYLSLFLMLFGRSILLSLSLSLCVYAVSLTDSFFFSLSTCLSRCPHVSMYTRYVHTHTYIHTYRHTYIQVRVCPINRISSHLIAPISPIVFPSTGVFSSCPFPFPLPLTGKKRMTQNLSPGKRDMQR
jgi:hypothetical protein